MNKNVIISVYDKTDLDIIAEFLEIGRAHV